MSKVRLADGESTMDVIHHVTHADGNVFSDLGFSEDEALKLKLQSDAIISEKIRIKETLMIEISNWMKQNRLKQVDAAAILGINRPRVSDIVQKKTAKFTIDALVDMLAKVGKQVHIAVH